MDYFYVGNHTNTVGLSNPFLKIGYKKDKQSVAAHIHSFYSAADILDTSTSQKMDSNLGTELDLLYRYTFSPVMFIQVGYSQMFATESMEAIKGGDRNETNNWGYIMLKFTPTLFEQAPKS